jgi:hypothetical protein
MPDDPYADPVTGVPRNKLALGTTRELEDAEREITHAALIFLKEAPDRRHREGKLVLPAAVHRVVRGGDLPSPA